MSYDNAKRVLYESWLPNFMSANNNDFAKASKLCTQWVNSRKLSQGELRLEVELNNTSTLFTFGVTTVQQNSNNILFKTERRLNQQDSLIASEYRFYVAAPTSRTDTNYKLRTYGNPVDFTAAQAQAIDGELLSNGEYSVKVNNDVIAPSRFMVNHLYRPQTQQTAALGAGSPDDQFRGAEDGAITQEPNLLIIGSKNYVPQVAINNAFNTDMEFTRLILIYTGVNAQNSTSIN